VASNRSLKPAIKKVLADAGIVPEYVKISKSQIAKALPGEDPEKWDPMVAYYVANCLLAYVTDEGLAEPLNPASMMQRDSHKKKLKIARKFRLFPVAESCSDDVVADLDTGKVWYIVCHSLQDGEPMDADRETYENLVEYFKSQRQKADAVVNLMTLRSAAKLQRQTPGVRKSAARAAVRENDMEWLRLIMASGLQQDCSADGPLSHHDILSDLLSQMSVPNLELAQYLAGDLGLRFKMAPLHSLVKLENLEFVLQLKRLGAFPPFSIPEYDEWTIVQRTFKEKFGLEVTL